MATRHLAQRWSGYTGWFEAPRPIKMPFPRYFVLVNCVCTYRGFTSYRIVRTGLHAGETSPCIIANAINHSWNEGAHYQNCICPCRVYLIIHIETKSRPQTSFSGSGGVVLIGTYRTRLVTDEVIIVHEGIDGRGLFLGSCIGRYRWPPWRLNGHGIRYGHAAVNHALGNSDPFFENSFFWVLRSFRYYFVIYLLCFNNAMQWLRICILPFRWQKG